MPTISVEYKNEINQCLLYHISVCSVQSTSLHDGQDPEVTLRNVLLLCRLENHSLRHGV